MTARVFQSIGISSGLVVPGVIVVDIFSPEDRGSKSGVWTQMVAIGAPLGGVIGGLVVHYRCWQWVMWLIAIMSCVECLAYILTCPETSYLHRQHAGLGAYHRTELTRIPKRLPNHQSLRSFIEPVLLLQSPHIVLIALAYGVTFAITSPGISVILPLALEEFYGFGSIAQGLFFIGPLVGVLLGERFSGPASDWVMNRERRQARAANRRERLESRLLVALPGYVMSTLGVLIFGITLQKRTNWIAPCIGFAVSNFGLQLVTTPLKTYCIDCYESRSASVLQLINVVRQVISFTVPFWSPNLNNALGYELGFGVEAIILVIFYLGSLLVLWRGVAWRLQVWVRGVDGGEESFNDG